MDARTRQIVRQRADGRCEYCRLPEEFDEWPFHVDHIIAQVHGGSGDPDNLCWACTQCNLHKGTNITSIDRTTGEIVSLFNPRQESWFDHFLVDDDGLIVGLTPQGRVTVQVLDMNGTPQLNLRRELIQQGEYPVR